MNAAIIAIGDELITGAVTDTNSAWISDRLLEIGLPASLHLSVGDDEDRIMDAFRLAGERAGHVIATGGLGPTEDDLTRDVFCRFAGVEDYENPEALQRIEEIFKAMGRVMTDNNRKQARIPRGATLIENPTGTAPGFYLQSGKAVYYFLPGVPRECENMMEATVLPLLAKTVKDRVFKILVLRTFGMTESQLDQTLKPVAIPAGVRLGYRAVFPEIHLKLIAEAADEKDAERKLARAAEAVRRAVGQVIYSEDGSSLEEVVLDLCRRRSIKLAVAESCTGGLIAKRLTDVAGSSDVLECGFVTYSNYAKAEILGVPVETIKEQGAVSSETAMAMAAGALEKSRADLAIAVTGIAGPTGGTEDKPVGTVHVAVADQSGVRENRFTFASWNRAMVRELTAQAALEIIRRTVLGLGELERR